MPAAVTTTCNAPNVSMAAVATASLSTRLVTSHRTNTARPPTASTAATVSAPRSACSSATTTAAPSSASRTAVARPMPFPAPVTTATLPASLLIGRPRRVRLRLPRLSRRPRRSLRHLAPGQFVVVAHLAGKPERPLGEVVALHLVGAATDRDAVAAHQLGLYPARGLVDVDETGRTSHGHRQVAGH